jgi:hypothetical protein
MKVRALKSIKHNGKRYKIGDDLTVDEEFAERLINLGAATVFVAVSDISDQEKDSLGATSNQKGNDNLNKSDGIFTDDELGAPDDIMSDEEVYQLIWDEFKLDNLKEQAAEIGLEFAGNITKGDLINLIINKEKENYFLEQIPE